MQDRSTNNFFFLNQEGRWPGFQWNGLERRDGGVLELATVPLFSGSLPEALKTAPAPDGPAGLAIDGFGSIYFSDPVNDRVLRLDGCDGSSGPIPCIGGAGTQLTRFSSPRGLLVPHRRRVLFIADSDNHRIQVFDLATLQLVEVWGQSSPGSVPKAGTGPGEFDTPWTLAGDRAGNVYVVDYGNHRVQKFNAIGDVEPAFSDNIRSSGLLQQPADVAVREHNGQTWIFVADATLATVFVFQSDGLPVLDSHGRPLAVSGSYLQQPMGLAVAGDALYAGDNARRRVARFHIGHEAIEFVGDAIGYDGPVAALLIDGSGGLLVHPGGANAPLRLQARSGCRSHGVLWNKVAIQVVDRKVVWHRLQGLLNPLEAGAHFDLFVYATSKDNDAPAVDPGAANPFADPKWSPASNAPGVDRTDLYIGGKPTKYLWVGALFLSGGLASPALSQLRVEFDYPTYDQYLPAIYRNQAGCEEFLVRLLSLYASFNQEVEGEIGSIPALFDPKAAPARFLAWLAGCLGLDLDANWDEKKQRRIIAEIFRLSGRRGTAAGLREILRLFAGVDAHIEEPILHAAWWSLPSPGGSCCEACAEQAPCSVGNWQAAGDSILGWNTMLAPAQPQGAVVGTSADLDQSHLITDDDFGAPLFTDVAYRFMVNVYRGQVMCADTLARIRSVLDAEKPAHTLYQLCIIEPRFRVGFQARVGIDTVVAGPPRSLALGSEQMLGEESVLAGAPVSRLGAESRLGVTTRLS